MKTLIPRLSEGENEVKPGLSIHVKTEPDQDHGAPWVECDGHGPVSDWTQRDKRAGEWILATDRSAKRYYDFAEAVRIAKRDRWGLNPSALAEFSAKLGRAPTRKEVASEAARRDFEYLRQWCADLWEYLIVTVELREGEKVVSSDSLGGVESFIDYWRECAAETADALLSDYEKEQAEREHWEARDVMTEGAR